MFARFHQLRSRIIVATALSGGLLLLGWAIGPPLAALAQEPEPASELYVDFIGVGWDYNGGAKKPYARVRIIDGNGNRVNGVRVTGDWSGCFKQSNLSATTETDCRTVHDGDTICEDGLALLASKKSYSCLRGKNCRFIFTVTGVQKDGMTYVEVDGKTSNGAICDPLSDVSISPQQGSSPPTSLVAFQRKQSSTSPGDSPDTSCDCGSE